MRQVVQRIRNTSIALLAITVIASVTTIILGTFAVTNFHSNKKLSRWELQDRTAVGSHQLASALALPAWNVDDAQVEKIIEGIMSNPEIYSVSFNSDEGTLIRSRGQNWQTVRGEGATPPGESLSATHAVKFSGETLGHVKIVSTTKFIDISLRKEATRFAFAILLFDILLILSLYLLAWRLVLKPLRLIERHALKVSAGQDVDSPESWGPFWGELESLRRSLDEMIRLLQMRFDELKSAKVAAEAADNAKTEFLNIAAHELRTPLTPLAILLQMSMKKNQRGQPIPQSSLITMMRQVMRLAHLVNELLDASRAESGSLTLQRSDTDLNRLAEECVEEFKLQAIDRPFSLELPQGSCFANVDSEKIHQVVANLLDNAIKYSPEKNPIEVKVAQPDPAKIRISVTDHGPGIPKDNQHRLFDRFFRIPSDATIRQSGLGLGLYLSRRLIDLHGGHIDVNSEPGKGTTFYFDLPKDAAA